MKNFTQMPKLWKMQPVLHKTILRLATTSIKSGHSQGWYQKKLKNLTKDL